MSDRTPWKTVDVKSSLEITDPFEVKLASQDAARCRDTINLSPCNYIVIILLLTRVTQTRVFSNAWCMHYFMYTIQLTLVIRERSVRV